MCMNWCRCLGKNALLSSTKMIVIDRDPRDLFVNAIKYRFFIVPREVDKFIEWYGYLMDKTEQEEINKEKVLRINFEELVFDYENSINNIISFLNIDKSRHANKKKYFNPAVSKKNIGLWKKHENQEDIKKIFKNLNKSCYNCEKLK